MAVIDVDTHFEPGRSWLDDHPHLAARLPEYSVAGATVDAMVGDLFADVPEDERPPWDFLLPPQIAAILGEEKVDGYGFAGSAMHTPSDPVGRLAWMDAVGIDVTNVLCLEGASYARTVDDPALAREAIRTCNTWLADQVAGNERRLMPATSLDLTDMDWALTELERMRSRGSRVFLVSPIPVAGLPPMHPYFEPLWSAAVDLGMVAQVHIGSGGNSFDRAWTNCDDGTVLRQLGACQNHQAAQLMLNGMVFGGVFDRHPNLTLVLAEFGVHWFAGTVDHMEARGPALPESGVYMGHYPYDLSPAEFVRRNVRITPLPRDHQSPLETLDRYPECVVFSSDYAHHESNPEPITHYERVLAGVDPALTRSFLGENMAECFRRTGDPLPATR